MALTFMAGSDYAKANRFVQEIATQADISGRLVEALLALARTSDVSVDRKHLDMDALVRDVIDSLRQGRPAELQLPVSIEGRLGEVDADPELTRQVLVNLIDNALKFTRTVAQPRVAVGAVGGPGGSVFFVRDNGVGFDADKATHRLFKPFTRLHNSPFEGSGVGLSIVKRIIDRHGGKIWAESAVGRGATFYFSFSEVGPEQDTR
jgi:signal transduction histidine kinase